MKQLRLIFPALFFLLYSISAFSQKNIKVPPKFISFKHSRFSIGVNLEGGLLMAASKPTGLNITYKDPRSSKTAIPYVAYGFVFDLYSANSIVGLLGGFDYSNSEFGLRKGDSTTDYMNVARAEIPLYLKFRFGSSTGTKHFWILLGGVYNIPIAAKREQFDARSGASAYTTLVDENKDQLKSYFALAGSIGYELFLDNQKHFRMAIFSRIVYPLSNELNPNYSQFKSTGNSVLRSYPNFDIKQYRISLGLKFMFQFGEALQIMAEAAKK